MIFGLDTLNAYTPLPTGTSPIRLIAPLQQMKKKHREATDKLALFGFSQPFDLLRYVLDIRFTERPGAEQRRLRQPPGVKVAIVKISAREFGEWRRVVH